MDYKEHHISFEKTGRFYTHGDPQKAKTLVLALHGYAQLARDWVDIFKDMDPSEFYIVCAEGPHRFYHKGRQGQVVASWMTKEDRLNDIKDYIAMLNNVYAEVTQHGSFDRKVLLGFSQGGATASRWIELGEHDLDIFILWASVFPPDLEQKFVSPLDTTKNYFVVGDNDEYFDRDRKSRQFRFLEEMGMNFELVNFNGNHRVDIPTLQKILR